MEQSKFGTFMIDDLYLYRASDDYKQVIEEKIVLPEYDKINQLKLLLSRTEYPISAKILIENGFSELTEELKENTGLKSCIIHLNPEKPDVPLNKNDAFQKVQKRRVQEKR